MLHKKKVVNDTTCEICHEEEESPAHIISGCRLGRAFWQRLHITSLLGLDPQSYHTLTPQPGVPAAEFSAFVALACWQLWKARNAAIFGHETLSVNQVLAACKATAEQWRYRMSRKKKHIADSWCQPFDMARTGQ